MVLGERTKTAKLHASDVVAMRALLRRGHGLDFTASLFEVSKRMVARIRDGLSWDEVSDRDEIIKQAKECPATLGCLLALVREAWNDHSLCANDAGPYDLMFWHVYTDDRNVSEGCQTEAEALVAALEAAP
jgi:hypothetical protein